MQVDDFDSSDEDDAASLEHISEGEEELVEVRLKKSLRKKFKPTRTSQQKNEANTKTFEPPLVNQRMKMMQDLLNRLLLILIWRIKQKIYT